MTEGNTCYGGGKPGVSDVFAAALWSADYSLLLATNGYVGVNLHGGTGQVVANGLGGRLGGDEVLDKEGKSPAEIASHPHPFYSPIGAFGSEYALEPVACGLMFAGSFIGGRMMQVDFAGPLQASGVNATAYGAELRGGRRSVILVNKDVGQDLDVELDFGGHARGKVEIESLQSPAIDGREAHIARSAKPGMLAGGTFRVPLPRGSGLRVTVG